MHGCCSLCDLMMGALANSIFSYVPSARFLEDLESRLQENVVISTVCDIIKQHVSIDRYATVSLLALGDGCHSGLTSFSCCVVSLF